MTSTVRVTAHCGEAKEVLVTVAGGGRVTPEQFAVQDGEVRDHVTFYDDITVTCEEREKVVAG